MRRFLLLLAALLGLFSASPASAQDINLQGPDCCLVRLASPADGGGQQFVGQTILAPAGQTRIVSIGFSSSDVPSTVVFRANIYAWDAGTTRATGPALFTSGDLSTTGATQQDINVSTGDVPVTPGEDYVIFLQATGGTGAGFLSSRGNVYADGALHTLTSGSPTGAAWSNIPADLSFSVDFELAAPTAVPTLTEWAMILLTLLLAVFGIFTLRRRQARVSR